jgi:hypothetical protein
MYKTLLFFFLGLITCHRGMATNFVVTSNADNGPGTLREAIALAAANGTATADLIPGMRALSFLLKIRAMVITSCMLIPQDPCRCNKTRTAIFLLLL